MQSHFILAAGESLFIALCHHMIHCALKGVRCVVSKQPSATSLDAVTL
jgi:hypothetical protein